MKLTDVIEELKKELEQASCWDDWGIGYRAGLDTAIEVCNKHLQQK